MIGCEANPQSVAEKDLNALKIIFRQQYLSDEVTPRALSRSVVRGQASRVKLILRYFFTFCLHVECVGAKVALGQLYSESKAMP